MWIDYPAKLRTLRRFMKISSLATAVLAMLSPIVSSAQFALVSQTNADACTWKIKNTSTDTLKLISVSIRFFHEKGDIIFTPSIQFPGGGKYQYKGNFSGPSGPSYHYKTIQIVSMDSTLHPGDEAVICNTSNTGNLKDTILAAGVKVYYWDSATQKSADAFREGAGSCPSEAVFINAGGTGSGIKMGSPAAQNLHTNNCESQLVAIAFDANSLLRKPISGMTPHCPTGRQWTTFGYSSDQQIYYSFDIRTQAGRSGFDSLVNGLGNGDFLALTNTSMESLKWFDSIRTTLAKIGFAPPLTSDTTGYYVILGKKGITAGNARYDVCHDPHGTCYASMEQSMVFSDFSGRIMDFGACYASSFQVLEKAQPQATRQWSANGKLVAYPNPSANGWYISGSRPGTSFTLYTLAGKRLFASSSTKISAENLPSGIYLLQANEAGYTTTIQLIKP